MSATPIKILYIEDSDADFVLFKKHIQDIPFQKYEIVRAADYEDLIVKIAETKYDIYFIDYTIDGTRTGLDYVREMQERDINGPFVLLTGYKKRDLFTESIETGVYDYLLKNEITPSLLERVIHHSMAAHKDAKERVQREKAEQQNQKIQSLGMLSSGIAHELNNMLQPIMLAADLVSGEAEGNETLQRASEIITRNTTRATNIVGNILSFSRFEDEEKELMIISQSILDSIEFIGDLIPKKVLIKHGNLIQDENLKAYITPQGMAHILTNILLNAAQAMDNAGEIKISSTVQNIEDEEQLANLELQADKEFYILEISDNGSGLPEKMIEKIFDPFFTTKEAGQGTGLGLSIVYSTIKSWDGAIEAENNKNGGATFRIYIPIESKV